MKGSQVLFVQDNVLSEVGRLHTHSHTHLVTWIWACLDKRRHEQRRAWRSVFSL